MELEMYLSKISKTSTTTMLIALGIVSACSRREPETFTASAEIGTTCVQNASEVYGVSLDYVTITALVEDPSGAYAYAFPGVVTKAAGASTEFLCRLDENRNFVDVVTWIPRN
jgi:hypothetical protein